MNIWEDTQTESINVAVRMLEGPGLNPSWVLNFQDSLDKTFSIFPNFNMQDFTCIKCRAHDIHVHCVFYLRQLI